VGDGAAPDDPGRVGDAQVGVQREVAKRRPEVRAAIAPAPGPHLRRVGERHEEGASLVDELLLLSRGQLSQATELALRRKDVVGPGGASVHDRQRHGRQQRQQDEQPDAGT
jgi:hypothetical protein